MFLPFGMHRIEVDRLDATDCVISTRESNRSVPVWNHVITMKALDDGHTAYTDEVVIGAGRKTGIVCIWAKAFYKHRQKRWRRMLNSLADQN